MFSSTTRSSALRPAGATASRAARTAFTVLLVASMTACGTSDVISGIGGTVTDIAVTLDPPQVSGSGVSINVGDSATVAATPLNELGLPLGGVSVTWSSENSAIATVSGQGVITGVTPGTTRIFATADGVTGQITVTVKELPGVPPPAS